MNVIVAPPTPGQVYVDGAMLKMTGDEGALLTPGQVYVDGAMLKMTGDEGALLVCVEEHERHCRPPPPQARSMLTGQC